MAGGTWLLRLDGRRALERADEVAPSRNHAPEQPAVPALAVPVASVDSDRAPVEKLAPAAPATVLDQSTAQGPSVAQVGARFHGRALASASRAPVRGASVQDDHPWVTDVHTDASGRFSVTLDESRRQLVRIRAEGFATTAVPVSPGHESPERELVIELQPEAVIRGSVLDPQGAPALGHVECALEPSIAGFTVWKEELDASGRFAVRSLPPGRRLRLSVHSPRERWSEPFVLVPGEERELEIVLADSVAVHGIAVDLTGVPVADLRLCMRRPSTAGRYFSHVEEPGFTAVTRGDGTFTIADVPPGSWWLGPAPSSPSDFVASDPSARAESVARYDSAAAPFAVPLEVPVGSDLSDVVLRVARGLRLRGRVVDSDGEPHVRATVRAQCDDLEVVHPVNNRDGAFVLGPLPDARFTITAELENGLASPPMTAQAGESGLVLRIERSELTLRVHAAVASGTEVVLARRGAPARPLQARTRNGGTATFEHLAPGTYDASLASSDGRWGGAVDLSPTEGALHELDLEPAATIDVSYMGPEYEVVLRALRGPAIVACATMRGGTSERIVVPSGPIRLELWLGQTSLVREVEAVPGMPLDVLLP